jgi:hypothetical protein
MKKNALKRSALKRGTRERDNQPAREGRGPEMRGFAPEISLPSLMLTGCCKRPNWVLAARPLIRARIARIGLRGVYPRIAHLMLWKRLTRLTREPSIAESSKY